MFSASFISIFTLSKLRFWCSLSVITLIQYEHIQPVRPGYKYIFTEQTYLIRYCIYLKASYFGPPVNPVNDNVEYGNSASKSLGVKSIQKTDIFTR